MEEHAEVANGFMALVIWLTMKNLDLLKLQNSVQFEKSKAKRLNKVDNTN
jgi:hypothetical protein